nr:alpha/beta fold hydrolase [Petrachloros mirabilis]
MSLNRQAELGHQRNWIWRGWPVRYTYFGAIAPSPAPPMLFLHGFGASIGHWRHNLKVFGQDRPVYGLDLLGFGASAKAYARYGTDFWVEQVHDFWQAVIRRPVVLVGNSLGSSVSLGVAARHPEIMAGLVMINLPDVSVIDLGVPPGLKALLRPVAAIAKLPLRILQGIATSPPLFSPFFYGLRHPRMIRLWARQAYASPEALTPELLAILTRPAYEAGAGRALAAMVRAPKPSPELLARTALPRIQHPVLLMWGEKDSMVPPTLATQFQTLSERIQLVMLTDAGHCPHDECPDPVNAQIQQWLATL